MADEQQRPANRRGPGRTRTSFRKGDAWTGNVRGKAANHQVLRAVHVGDAVDTLAEATATSSEERGHGSNPNCRVCQSPLRPKIERWVAQGLSYTAIERRLRERYDEPGVSRHSVKRHCDNHVNVTELQAAYYAVHRDEIDAKSSDGMSVLERLEAEAVELYRRGHDIGEVIDVRLDRGESPSLPQVQLYTACIEEHRQRVKLINELRGAQPADEVDVMLAQLWDVLPPVEQPDEPEMKAPTSAADATAGATH